MAFSCVITMCGIVGFISLKGSVPAGEILSDGLKCLEYRGYDSCGICVLNEGKLSVRKDIGKISEVARNTGFASQAGATGIGHCLHPDTYVQLSNGEVKKIRDIDKTKVPSICTGDLRFSNKEAFCGKHPSTPQLIELQTASFSLKCTPQHRMFIFKNGAIAEKTAGEIEKGDLIVCAAQVQISGETQALKGVPTKRYYAYSKQAVDELKLKMSERNISCTQLSRLTGISVSVIEHFLNGDRNLREDFLQKLSLELGLDANLYTPTYSIHGKFISLPSATSPELAQFLGYLLGDGIVNRGGIRFKDADQALLTKYNELCHKLFGISGRVVKIPEANAHLLEINSKFVCDWIRLNFPELTLRHRQKTIPVAIQKSTTEEVNAFLRGLFDAEGCVSTNSRQIIIKMNNEDTIRVAQMLLLRSGIASSFSAKERQWGLTCGLAVNTRENLTKFSEKIGFYSYHKSAKLNEIIPQMSWRSSNSFKLPFTRMELRNHAQNKNQFKTNSLVNNSLASKVPGQLQAQGATIVQQFLGSDLFFQRVAKKTFVKSETEFVYDLEVPGSPNFIANGLLSHNSRWATHGGVTQQNAHPHQDCSGNIAVVHNGIIENYQQLRAELQAKGHAFHSQTDTEVIPHLIEEELKHQAISFEQAVRKALLKIHGSYAILAMSAGEPHKLVAARNESPLIIGIAPDALYAASDAVPFLPKTRNAVFLNDGEMAVLSTTGNASTSGLLEGKIEYMQIVDGSELDKEVSQISWSAESASKAGYEHFMLKEINEQPLAVKNALAQDDEKVQRFADELKKAKNLIIIGMGTARHAGLVARYAMEKLARKHAEVMMASEYGYFAQEADKDTVILAISQSGETADVLVPAKKAKENGARIFSIVNVVGSTLDRISDERLHINAGPEIAVASTKAFTNQVVVGTLVAYAMAGKLEEGRKVLSELPAKISQAIEWNDANCRKMAQYLKGQQHAYYIGRGINFAIAVESALKMKEISYLHAEGMPAGELKHGTLALVEKGTPVVAINPPDYTFGETLSNAMETRARGALVIGVSTKENEAYDELVKIPQADELLYPLLSAVPLQLLAYYTGLARGCDIDRPRNLAKAVTVK